jgi:hypothetical protein
VSGSVSGARPTYAVVVRVAGLGGGATAQLRIEGVDAQVVRTGDARCTVVRTVATCQLAGDTSVSVEVVVPQGGSVVAGLTPTGEDSTTGNNTWRAPLG